MKLFWTGTDSLMLIDYSMRKFYKKVYWFVFRVLIRLLDRFVDEHYCDSENVADNVRKFGTRKPVSVLKDRMKYPRKFKKLSHNKFNVIYYKPTSKKDDDFLRWLYGLDIIEEVKQHLPKINFIELNGSVDMSKIYPITDFMLRPNRHDGSSRMVQECEINDIPYYPTWGDNASIKDIIEKIKEEQYDKKTEQFSKL